jgi:hypothetical protein
LQLGFHGRYKRRRKKKKTDNVQKLNKNKKYFYYYLGWLLESANLLRTEGRMKVANPRITTAII